MNKSEIRQKIIQKRKVNNLKKKIQINFNSILKQGLGHDQHTIIEIFASPSHSNLFSASFTDNKDGTFSPNDIHQMIPFDNYDYVSKALKHRVNLEK